MEKHQSNADAAAAAADADADAAAAFSAFMRSLQKLELIFLLPKIEALSNFNFLLHSLLIRKRVASLQRFHECRVVFCYFCFCKFSLNQVYIGRLLTCGSFRPRAFLISKTFLAKLVNCFFTKKLKRDSFLCQPVKAEPRSFPTRLRQPLKVLSKVEGYQADHNLTKMPE